LNICFKEKFLENNCRNECFDNVVLHLILVFFAIHRLREGIRPISVEELAYPPSRESFLVEAFQSQICRSVSAFSGRLTS
jgi:hypothetical protein